ncbi:MAG: alanine/ornithine racemase family PLP-dependent enzyme [Candidatus Sedimenticola sp. PURPLELP]
MTYPYLTIDLGKIEHNARTIVQLCDEHRIEVTGVTKVTCGSPEVARAMIRGGVTSIADSRFENIRRLHDAGIEVPLMLLRLPPLSGASETVSAVSVSLNSEPAVLKALSDAATDQGVVHEVIIMVDLGDLREGIWPDDLISVVEEVLGYPGIRLSGIGANLACFGGVVPSEETMSRLVALAERVERRLGGELKWLSGINSSGLDLVVSGDMPTRVNHARIGEAILLGRETTHRKPWPGTHQDAFLLHAEVLELKRKPSVPLGEQGEDAFGNSPVFESRGSILRALLNVGREDVDVSGLMPVDERLSILGASSGYLVVDVTAAENDVSLGDELVFTLNYSALLAAMTSEYVKKRYSTDKTV